MRKQSIKWNQIFIIEDLKVDSTVDFIKITSKFNVAMFISLK